MNFVMNRWLRAVRNLFPRPSRPLARRTRRQWRLEHLEDRLTPSPVITTLAGNGSMGYGGDNGPAAAAMLYTPSDVAVDSSGDVFIADTYNNRIREIVKSTGNIITVAGTGNPFYNGDNIPATVANLYYPHGIAVDASGNLFIADTNNNRIREVVKSTGAIITVAGTGAAGYSGDNGPATAAQINAPWGVALDGNGNVYFTDQGNNRVREIKTNGVIVTIAGTGTAGFSGDDGAATAPWSTSPAPSPSIPWATSFSPTRSTIASAKSARTGSSSPSPAPARWATTATASRPRWPTSTPPTGWPWTARQRLHRRFQRRTHPHGVEIVRRDLYLGRQRRGRLRRRQRAGDCRRAVLSQRPGGGRQRQPLRCRRLQLPRPRGPLRRHPFLGAPSTTAWTVNQTGFSSTLPILGGTAPYSGLSATGLPPGVFAGVNGSNILLTGTPTSTGTFSVNLGVSDANGFRTTRAFSFTVNVTPSLGALTPAQGTAGVSYPGAIPVNGGTSPFTITTSANLPPGLTAVVSGSSVGLSGIPTTTGVYNNIQLKIIDASGATASGVFSLTINAPAPGSILTVAGTGSYGYSGDGGPANKATLGEPYATAVDSAGDIFIADTYNNRIREIVKATGNIITVAGTGTPGFSGDGGTATSAKLYYPTGVAVDSAGNLFIDDWYNYRIREVVKATGNIITIAGNGATTSSGDGGPATSAGLANPWALAIDSSDNVYIADRTSNRIREVNHATGIITTVAGNGTSGSIGDGGPATAAELSSPDGVAVDAAGNIYIADTNNNRIREVVKATGNIITFAGNGTAGYSGDNGPAVSAKLNSPRAVSVDAAGDLFIADTFNYRIREVSAATGNIVTVAGNGTSGYSGDGGPAVSAKLGSPYGMAIDSSGDLFYADYSDYVVREVLASSGPVLGALTSTSWTANHPGFSATSAITGGRAPYSGLSVTGLPAGLTASLNGGTITLSGTPTTAGTFANIAVSVHDANGLIGSRTFSITVNAAPTLAR